MEKNQENISSEIEADTSDYVTGDGPGNELDFNNLFSNQFGNITLFYESPNGPTLLYTATRFGKRYILKCLKEQYRKEPIYNLWLAKEFEIGISLDHPNIRRTLNLETVEGLGQTIVLEYLNGNSLKELIDKGNITPTMARSIAEQTVEALSYIHAKQVYHRDLKPANILVSCHGNVVKIIDFNYADSDEFVVLKSPAGSLKYMAPEQLQPDAQPTAVADIYSFGVVMSELAAVAGDEMLAETVAACKDVRPEKRPQSASMITLPKQQQSAFQQTISVILSSKLLTYILLIVCAALLAAIAYMLNQK